MFKRIARVMDTEDFWAFVMCFEFYDNSCLFENKKDCLLIAIYSEDIILLINAMSQNKLLKAS